MDKKDAKIYNEDDFKDDLDDIFGDSEVKADKTSDPSVLNKPVNTVIGSSFDAIENKLKARQNGSSGMLNKVKYTLFGKKDEEMEQKTADKIIQVDNPDTPQPKPANKFKSTIMGLKNKVMPGPKSLKANTENRNPTVSAVAKVVKAPEIKKSPPKKAYSRESSEDDIFDESGNIAGNGEKEEVKELAALFFTELKKLLKPITILVTKVITIVLKIGIALIAPFSALLAKLVKSEKKLEQKPEKNLNLAEVKKNTGKLTGSVDNYLRSTFGQMIDLNINFTDNSTNVLYRKGNFALTKTEEKLIMTNAIIAIQQCAAFTRDSPPITDGPYKDKRIENIMLDVTEDEISLYLAYVKTNPKKYIGKPWKISETFATWLLKNSPMIEK